MPLLRPQLHDHCLIMFRLDDRRSEIASTGANTGARGEGVAPHSVALPGDGCRNQVSIAPPPCSSSMMCVGIVSTNRRKNSASLIRFVSVMLTARRP
jgi:hypothetical protein